nr:AAA family ATPase [uncultured Sediminibacterium sp.]
MELLYLWLDNFRNIQEQGFDFSSEITFSIKKLETKNGIKYIDLSLSLNPNYIPLFPENIVNITGIVGANASGKTNLMDGIKLLAGRMMDIASGLFFCVLNHKTNTIETYYYESGGVKRAQPLHVTIQSDDDLNNKFNVNQAVGYPIDRYNMISNSITLFEDNQFPVSPLCYLSNSFDNRNETLYTGIHNLSTNARLESFFKSTLESKSENKESIPSAPYSESYHRKELRTLLSFIALARNNGTTELPDIPQSLIIEFNFNELEYLRDNFSLTSSLFQFNDLELVHNNAIEAIQSEIEPKEKIYNLIVLCSFYYALRWDIFKPHRIGATQIQEKIKQFSQIRIGKFLFEEIYNFLHPISLNPLNNKSNTLEYLLGEKMKLAINQISLIAEQNISNPLRFRVKIEEELWSFLNLIFSFRYLEPSSFMDYKWENLSSGQEAFFLQFGRLNEIKNDITKKMFWLLIDEGDLYFHPQWQKSYIEHLFKFITLIFPDKKVQIFITSHSPFIASDLPRSNLIFLKRGSQNKCEVTDIATQKLTFGANIHMLYTDSFFLDSVVGSFAQKKIQEFINWATDKNSPPDDDGNKQKFINLIGEPIISAKLLELYAIKMGKNFELTQLLVLRNKIEARITEIKRDK